MPLTNVTETELYTLLIKVPQDGDKVDAITVQTGVTGLANRTKYLKGRTDFLEDKFVNGYDTISPASYSAQINWSGIHSFTANVFFTGSVQIGSGGSGTFNCFRPAVFSEAIDAQDDLDVGGALNVVGAAVFENPTTHQGRMAHDGDNAWRALRKKIGSATSVTGVELWTADLWIVPAIAWDIAWQLDPPPFNSIVEVTIYKPNAGHSLLLNNPGDAAFAIVGTGGHPCVKVMYDGSDWFVSGVVPF